MPRNRTHQTRRPRTPLWVVEGLDITRLRRVPFWSVAGVAAAVGIVLAVVLPDLIPPTPLVGAAVGLAALLLGLAAAVAVDAADLTVRGPRHVRAAGGELVAVLPSHADADAARPLAEAVLEAREDGSQRLLLGLAAAGRDARRCAAWTDALADALARTGVSVLRVDLANGRSERPGLVEVVREGRKLPSVVTFDPELRLARIGAGRDHAGALEVLPTLPTRLPRDLDVLLVALPTAASRQVVAATRALDHVLVVAERDTTSRVDLIAGLDAMEAAGIAAQVALLDDRTAARLAAPVATAVAPSDAEPASPAPLPADAQEVGGTTGAEPAAAAPLPADAQEVGGTTEPEPASPAPLPADAQEVGGTTGAEPASPAPLPADAQEVGDATGAEPASEPGPLTRRLGARAAAPDAPDHGIRLLPGATPPGAPSPDLGQPSVVAPRDVDVLDGAAAARAAARSNAADDELPPIGDHRPRRTLDVADPVDVTGELPRLGRDGRPSRGEDAEDDDLRTTAQLAILIDDLQARGERP
jgi:hypothetical protein